MYQTPAYIFKRMVYAFYASNDNNFIDELHYKLLERYINVFDEVIFCIIIDDINDRDTISNIEKRITSFRNGDVIFKVYENSNYRESEVFYNEIFLQMERLHGMTFFAHSKGKGVMETTEEIIAFITAIYYFSLNDLSEIGNQPFYGSLKMINNTPLGGDFIRHKWFYVGTFFWGDYQRIHNECKKFPYFSSRWFDETFPGELYNHEKCGSFHNEYIDASKKPLNAFELIERIHGNDEQMQDYLSLYNEFINYFI